MTTELAAAVAAFATRGGHPVRDALAIGPAPFAEWDHYPEGEAADPATGYSWYYHAHPQTDPLLTGSHGHFHLYASPALFGATAPINAPANGDTADPDSICLLLSLAMNTRGKPQALFALNRLGAGQWIYPAAATLAIAERFALGSESPCPDVGRWLAATIRAQRPAIAELLAERDRALEGSTAVRDADGRCPEVLVCHSLA